MTRVPVLATVLVGLAVAAMIALGCWQLFVRAPEKAELLHVLASNRGEPPIAFPHAAQGDALLFRRASVLCASVKSWESQAGRDGNGASGWRQVAHCANGPVVQMGISDSVASPAWPGGGVSGYIAYAPDQTPAIARAFSTGAARTLMLVSDRPAPGLRANPGPDLDAVPNNHVAYAVQWFLFAGVAVIIYALALRRRRTGAAKTVQPPRDPL